MENNLGEVQSERTRLADRRRIAVVGLNIFDGDTPELKAALHRNLIHRSDWRVVFASEAYTESIQLLQKIPCDGVLARIVTPAMAEQAKQLSCPVVNISSLLENPGIPTVRRDDRYHGQLCARHLLNQGYERFGLVREALSDWCFQATEHGFLEELNGQKKPLFISTYTLDMSQAEHGIPADFSEWLHSLKPPFGLFLLGDRFAAEIMKICRGEALRIPTDVAVISSAAHAHNLRQCLPTLTHCEPDGEWLIRPACEYLEELMQNPGQSPRCLDIPVPGLVLGDSTNALAVEDPCVRRALEFMESSFCTGIDVGDIARQIHCGRRLLELRFKKTLGCSLHGYLAKKRIQYAKSLMMADPDQKLLNIASRAGFREIQAFRDSFLRLTGQTPSAWRQQLKSGTVCLENNDGKKHA